MDRKLAGGQERSADMGQGGKGLHLGLRSCGRIGAVDNIVVPPIKTRDFNFQSISDAV
jgi:hypothetical protein